MASLTKSIRYLTLRRNHRFRPNFVPIFSLPTQSWRPITIQAPGPTSTTNDSEGSSGRFEIVPDQSGVVSATPSSLPINDNNNTGGSSQHPFALSSFTTSSNESGSGSNTDSDSGPSSSINPTNLPAPPEPVQTFKPLHLLHPFDTHAFVTYLEKSEIPLGRSKVLMEAVRKMIVTRGERTRDELVGKEEQENEAYLFRAALSELRTELSVRARNDGLVLRTMTGAIRREVEGLEQKLKEDVATLKHDIEMDMNNRKSETRTEMKGFDIAIEEINNKFTISLGDLRTEIESAKWDATRRAISIIVLIVIAAIAVSSYSTATAKATPVIPPKPATMRDMAVGSDDTLSDDEVVDYPVNTEGELERLLRNSGLEAKGKTKLDQKNGPGRGAGKGKDVDVDRI